MKLNSSDGNEIPEIQKDWDPEERKISVWAMENDFGTKRTMVEQIGVGNAMGRARIFA